MTPRRSLSITGNLTLFYMVSTSLLLFLAGIFLYMALTADLEKADTKFLADETEGLRMILKESRNGPRDLEEEVLWEGNAGKLLNSLPKNQQSAQKAPDARRRLKDRRDVVVTTSQEDPKPATTQMGLFQQTVKYYAAVLDENGRTLIQTTGMDRIGDMGKMPFPEPCDIREYPEDSVKWRSPNGKTYLLMSAWAQNGPDEKNKRLLRLVSDITDDETLVENYRRQLFIVLFAGVLLASVTGSVIARRGLKPLINITQAIHGMSATQLHERIGREKWPTELISLAGEFDRMLDRLENSFNRLNQFSADLAHELRTPINILMGGTEVILSKTRTTEEYKELLQSNLEEYSILSRMIDRLLFLARTENPETVVEKTISEVRREAEVVMEYYDAVAKEKGIKIVCNGGATLSADFSLLRRALSNLVSNALQHSPEGSEIHILIEKKKDNVVEIKVRDQGEGIPAEHLSRIFDRFYRPDSSRSKDPRGAGLGLAIVRSIMKLHGGTVSIESVPNRGTIATLIFPSS